MPPPNSYVEAITPNVTVFGAGAFERSLYLDEVMRVGPHGRISALIRRDTRELSVSLSLSCEGTSQKVAGCKPGREPSLEPNHASTLISDS